MASQLLQYFGTMCTTYLTKFAATRENRSPLIQLLYANSQATQHVLAKEARARAPSW